jgi:hypothetical protein
VATSCGTRHTGPPSSTRSWQPSAPRRRAGERPTGHTGEAARAEAAKLLAGFEDDEVVVSLAAYQALVDDMGRRVEEYQP